MGQKNRVWYTDIITSVQSYIQSRVAMIGDKDQYKRKNSGGLIMQDSR